MLGDSFGDQVLYNIKNLILIFEEINLTNTRIIIKKRQFIREGAREMEHT